MVVTVTHGGYIKRTPLATFRAQNRGGKGRAGMATKDEDAVTELFVTSNAHPGAVLLATSARFTASRCGNCPKADPPRAAARWSTCCRWAKDETISNVLTLPEDEAEWGGLSVVFATAKGYVRRNSMDAFANVPSNGKIAMRFEGEDADDRLIGVELLDRRRRCAAGEPRGQGDPLCRRRRPRIPEPHLHRRARA